MCFCISLLAFLWQFFQGFPFLVLGFPLLYFYLPSFPSFGLLVLVSLAFFRHLSLAIHALWFQSVGYLTD